MSRSPALSTYSTVVGIPARNEEGTVASVAQAADVGLTSAGLAESSVIVLADNGSTDRTVQAFGQAPLTSARHVLASGSPWMLSGKGTNVFALIAFAIRAGAERLILLDSDLRSARHEWIGRLAAAVETEEPAMALPVYERDRYEAGTTNHIVTPLLEGLFGASVQQPIGGEFAFNRAFLLRTATWPRPDSAYLYGIDVWLTANALRVQLLLTEVYLGTKLHSTPFENVLHLPQQVLDSLLYVAQLHCSALPSRQRQPVVLPRTTVSADAAFRQPAASVSAVTKAARTYIGRHHRDIATVLPSAANALRQQPGDLIDVYPIDSPVWPSLLAEAIKASARGDLALARDHLIALYVNRLVTFWSEIDGESPSYVEGLLRRQLEDSRAVLAPLRGSLGQTTPTPAFSRGLWHDLAGPPPR